VDGALAICKLERFVGDLALDGGWSYAAAAAQRHERIAVVGGGPAGLSAAYQLRRRGYAVTIFESQPELGGLMRDGIPGYRLARAVLDAEIARVLALGIEVRRGQALSSPQALQALREEFDAVVLAIGARRSKRLAQLDYGQPWVIDGAEYLARSNLGQPPALGRRVVVVGGGSAALDAARSARRAGHEVTILALESEHEMPAQREEVVEALEEGIALVGGAMPTGATVAGAAGLRLDCVRVQLQRGADRSSFTVTQQPGSSFVLEADAVVTSIGQDPELGALTPAFETQGPLLKTDAFGATGVDRVWAGGDLASGARFVSEAIAMGERAALAIDRRLRKDAGQDDTAAPAFNMAEPTVTLAAINLHYHPATERAAAPHLAVAQRLAQGGEVQLGLSMAQALGETVRCYSCGSCTHCDNCVSYCPDLAVQRHGEGYRVLGDYCKGCGLCVKECPSGSMAMVEELR
jgi:NADPH-dependent glutamate synthase beta subunit-like oxidoreductase/NAD-dependent dihydropyrimidine dehydrogenase PreA subunit